MMIISRLKTYPQIITSRDAQTIDANMVFNVNRAARNKAFAQAVWASDG